MKRVSVIITSDFCALHSWKNCPVEEVSFLRNTHRHRFLVKVKIRVRHNDREKEFFMLKQRLDSFLRCEYEGKDLGSKSCEMLAERIGDLWPEDIVSVEVWEDGENGACIEYD